MQSDQYIVTNSDEALGGVTVGHCLNLVWGPVRIVNYQVVAVDSTPGWAHSGPTDSRVCFRDPSGPETLYDNRLVSGAEKILVCARLGECFCFFKTFYHQLLFARDLHYVCVKTLYASVESSPTWWRCLTVLSPSERSRDFKASLKPPLGPSEISIFSWKEPTLTNGFKSRK